MSDDQRTTLCDCRNSDECDWPDNVGGCRLRQPLLVGFPGFLSGPCIHEIASEDAPDE